MPERRHRNSITSRIDAYRRAPYVSPDGTQTLRVNLPFFPHPRFSFFDIWTAETSWRLPWLWLVSASSAPGLTLPGLSSLTEERRPHARDIYSPPEPHSHNPTPTLSPLLPSSVLIKWWRQSWGSGNHIDPQWKARAAAGRWKKPMKMGQKCQRHIKRNSHVPKPIEEKRSKGWGRKVRHVTQTWISSGRGAVMSYVFLCINSVRVTEDQLRFDKSINLSWMFRCRFIFNLVCFLCWVTRTFSKQMQAL